MTKAEVAVLISSLKTYIEKREQKLLERLDKVEDENRKLREQQISANATISINEFRVNELERRAERHPVLR